MSKLFNFNKKAQVDDEHKIEKFKEYYEVFYNVFKHETKNEVIVFYEGARFFFSLNKEGKVELIGKDNDFQRQERYKRYEIEPLRKKVQEAFNLSEADIFAKQVPRKTKQMDLFNE